MSQSPNWLAGLVGAGLLAGCSSMPQQEPMQVVPFAAIRDAADTADGYYSLGRGLQRAGKFEDAERAYRLALSLDPMHAEARNGLAAVSVSRGDLRLAISILEPLVAAHPDRPHLLANLGHAYYLDKNYFEARLVLERAARLDPANPRIAQKLALVSELLGEPVAAAPELAGAADLAGSAEADAQQGAPIPAPPLIIEMAPGVHLLRPSPNAGMAAAPPPAALSPAPRMAAAVPEPMPVPVPAPLPAPQKTASREQPSVPDGRLEILNGNGVAGLARRLRELMHGTDWQVVRVANHAGFDVRVTRIEYAASNSDSAHGLARMLPVDPVYRHEPALGPRIRVILGHDLRSLEPVREQLARNAQGLPRAEARRQRPGLQFTATGAISGDGALQTTSLSIE